MRWRGQSVLIIASGPSLTEEDAQVGARLANRVITINESWRTCPNADVLYAADPDWWQHRAPAAEAFTGERWTQDKQWGKRTPPAGVEVMESRGGVGLSSDPSYIFQGANSGFQALGLAVNWGASRIVLLGFDMSVSGEGKGHWHTDYDPPLRNAKPDVYRNFAASFIRAAPQLRERGILVVNASRETRLDCFPRASIEVALR